MDPTIKNIILGMGSVLVIMPTSQTPRIGVGILDRSQEEAISGDWQQVRLQLQEATAGEPQALPASDGPQQKK